MPTLRFAARLGSLLLAGMLASACSKPTPTDGNPTIGSEALPAPATKGGSVTGMPDPGVAIPQPPPLATPQVQAEDTATADANTPATADNSDPTMQPGNPAPALPAPPAATTNTTPTAEPVPGK